MVTALPAALPTATNIDATAVNTIGWLSSPQTTIVVPVYQRQYRWDIGGCEKLLADIRAVSDSDDRHTHFIGSILCTASTASTGDSGDTDGDDSSELVLIDGQQRITTLMLLVAALHHTVLQGARAVAGTDAGADLDAGEAITAAAADDGRGGGGDGLAGQLEGVLVRGEGSRASGASRTKLRPHRAWAEVFESVVLGRRLPGDELRDSRFDDNYAFFRSQIRPDEVARIWRGLQKLEHVAITLGADANAQQIFESLNSTGEPLRDHELIHNYVLMGLSHAEQNEIENSFWLPIEQNTGEQIASFWRHYLVMTTGREVTVAGGRGVYDEFRQQFPRLDLEALRVHAAEWREYSSAYRVLLEPASAADAEIGQQLGFVNTFGRGMYPLVMRAYCDYERGTVTKAALIETLELVQSLLLRRTVVGVSNDRLVARLCRARAAGHAELVAAVARITPSNERVRVALKYSELPHAAYVLGRLAGARAAAAGADAAGAGTAGVGTAGLDAAPLDLEHIFPVAPADSWSGDGVREWADYSDDEQNSHRALSGTLGNLTLLERPLAERAADASFTEKQSVYAKSAVATTTELAEVDVWGTSAIAERTARLTDVFLKVWGRPTAAGIDDDDLTPILDAKRRRGWPRGWQREFEYVEYRGEHWEVYDVKYLFNRIFKRLWNDSHESVVAFSARRGGPIYDAQAWNGHWDQLDDSNFLYMGWDSRYMLTAVQGVLEEAGLAAEVFVKYSYLGAAMP
ncbi:DUF262 domain-containing HNH endonuclease family protein [Subtercola sp. PAMC28395]|uniref:DUF262 domain-containing protein n=1 Tax=Subtercola sp. PAMC28395 TaxID=2846775 RepID=UPI001C0C166C|nr:DUF262 domain-containing protein [Subtercola sp. PAMC28395]QWT25118.1 DUF262 domain-containing HNH endonuclease family protein [Subtercola sp. PAMC28395]